MFWKSSSPQHDMDLEFARYIRWNFPRLLTEKKHIADLHINHSRMIGKSRKKEDLERDYEEGYLTRNPEALALTKGGYEKFIINVGLRIMKESPEQVFINRCSRCNQLARKPQAKQCRCGHNWREMVAAEISEPTIVSSPQGNSELLLSGTLKKGEVNKGMRIDLTSFGMNQKPQIAVVDTLVSPGKIVRLRFNIQDETDRKYLLKVGQLHVILSVEHASSE